MEYCDIYKGTFIFRPNRFIANVLIDNKIEVCHVKNTGRCKELLTENACVFLEKTKNPLRKTQFDLIAVIKGDKIINMDSFAPNIAAEEFFKKKYKNVLHEVKYKNSRFDIFIEDTKTFVEVKGVTLEKDGIAMFPDAPTERGRKHIYELIDAKKMGYNAEILFVIQFENAKKFIPNYQTDPKFKEALVLAKEAGVKITAMDSTVNKNSMYINKEVEVCLDSFLPI